MESKLSKNLAWFLGVYRTSLRRCLRISDYGKWRSVASLSPKWDSRTKLIATLIPPGTSVLEFGAGRMVLRSCVPEGCRYTPSDLVSRGDGTLICDLNAKVLPDFPAHDVAVFSGVLEYVNDVPRLVSRLSESVGIVIASYASTDYFPEVQRRRVYGWVNDYSSRELLGVFAQAGFRCDETQAWRSSQIIGKFSKDRPRAGNELGNSHKRERPAEQAEVVRRERSC